MKALLCQKSYTIHHMRMWSAKGWHPLVLLMSLTPLFKWASHIAHVLGFWVKNRDKWHVNQRKNLRK